MEVMTKAHLVCPAEGEEVFHALLDPLDLLASLDPMTHLDYLTHQVLMDNQDEP